MEWDELDGLKEAKSWAPQAEEVAGQRSGAEAKLVSWRDSPWA